MMHNFGSQAIKKFGKCWSLMMYYLNKMAGAGLPCTVFSKSKPRRNGRHFADNILELICWIFIQISLKFILNSLINNKPLFEQILE